MAIVLNTIVNPDKLSLINSNFSKLAAAINESLVWRNGSTAGETSFTRDLDINGYQILNAYVGSHSLDDLVETAYGASDAAAAAAASALSASTSATSANASAVSAAQSASDAAALTTFIAAGTGAVNRTYVSKMRDTVSVLDYGAKGDGVTNSTSAFILALQSGATNVYAPAGVYVITSQLSIPAGVSLYGDGVDYWDTYRPAPGRLLKSWSKGTHLLFSGTGVKTDSIINLMNARDTKVVAGVSYPFTSFTNEDSSSGNAATAKPFSCAVKATHASQISNLRIMLNYNGISGYNDSSLTGLGDNWDVGLWCYDGSMSGFYNVQVCGYWRIAGTLLTENDGTYTQVGNPECITFDRYFTQGRRGLLVRNSAQIDVTSNTNTSITCKYNTSFTLSSIKKFKILGSSQTYDFTSWSASGNSITLSGVTPDLPASVTVIRAPNIGNNFSGTVFSNFKTCSLDHTSGNSSNSLGLGEAGALEIDGFPVRNLKFVNFKAQTTFDRLNSILGDMRDAKFIASEHENGAMIAYSNAETIGFTENIRYINSEISPSCDISAFTPREAFIDYKQFPTQFTDGSFIIKPWRETDVSINSFTDVKVFRYRSADLGVELKNGAAFQYMSSNGATNETVISGNNISLKNTSGTNILTLFSTSLNATFGGAVTTTGDVVSGGNIRPSTDNSKTSGTSSLRWLTTYSIKNLYTATVGDFAGAGSPEGSITAGVGSTYRRTDGAALTSFYVKETGTGNTGWVAK